MTAKPQPADLLALERVLAMALQHIRICAPNKEVEDAIESVSVESLAAHRGEGYVAEVVGVDGGGDMRINAIAPLAIGTKLYAGHPPQAQAGAFGAEDRVDVALTAYNCADYQWMKLDKDERDEPRHRFAMRAALAALEAKP